MANRGMPSILALLGMAAVAGYQNRDKLGQILGQVGNQVGNQTGNGAGNTGTNPANTSDLPGQLGAAGSVLSQTASSVGGSLMTGLNDLLDTFRNAGQKDVADSWITPGVPTQGLNRDQVEAAIGREQLENLARDVGLDYNELVSRLAKTIPEAVDRATPEGRFPQTDDEVRQRFSGF